MSHAKDIAQNSTAICIAVLGLGAAAGSVAISAAGLVAIGLQIFKAQKSICERAVARVMKDIEKSGTESAETLQAAHDLLANNKTEVTLNRIDLPEAAKQEDFYSAVIEHLMQSFPKHADYNALQLIRLAMSHAFQACRYEEAFHVPLTQELLVKIRRDSATLLQGQMRADEERAVLHTKVDASNDLLVRILEHVENDPKHREEVERRGNLVIALASKYAEGDLADFDGALRGLERALETAAEERDKGRLPGNVSDAVEAVVARVDALNDEGRIDEAAAELARLDADHKDEFSRLEEVRRRLIGKRLSQARLTNDPKSAAEVELERVRLRGGRPELEHMLQYHWYKNGLDLGLNFDLATSIQIGRKLTDLPLEARLRFSILGTLSNALQSLGERTRNIEMLMESIDLFRNLEEFYKGNGDRLNQAETLHNLGNVHAIIGLQNQDRRHTELSKDAFRKSLKILKSNGKDLRWAFTLGQYANASAVLADIDGKTKELKEALRQFGIALHYFSENKDVPGYDSRKHCAVLSNASTTALQLAKITDDLKTLEAAIDYAREALAILEKTNFPEMSAKITVVCYEALLEKYRKTGEFSKIEELEPYILAAFNHFENRNDEAMIHHLHGMNWEFGKIKEDFKKN